LFNRLLKEEVKLGKTRVWVLEISLNVRAKKKD